MGLTTRGAALLPPLLLLLLAHAAAQAILDSRCYLMNGGAVESFYIAEDTPVGAVIGTLSVNGDASVNGDITLRLQERNAAVALAPHSKNLTLTRALDREERLGPSSVYVNVRCDRRRTTDPSFVIPVSVRVWDVNDNAPAWQWAGGAGGAGGGAGGYRARVSELTAVGARLAAAPARDDDQPGPHSVVHYSVLPGPYQEYVKFANELDSVIVLAKPLDYETLRNFTVTLRAEDQGQPPRHNDTTLEVEVTDADDQNPAFTHDHYTAVLPDDAVEGTELEISPGPISASDQDLGIRAPVRYSSTGEQRALLRLHADSGRAAAAAPLLAQHAPVTIVLKATQVDNPDRYAFATLTISRPPRAAGPPRPPRFLQPAYSAAVPEDTPVGATLLTLHTDTGDTSPALQFYVSERSFLDQFAISARGAVLLRRGLDYEARRDYAFHVMLTDGRANDTASLNITVLNVNDWEPRFRYPQYSFRVEGSAGDAGDEAGGAGGAGAGLMPVGKVDVFDGDKDDYVSLSLRGPDAGLFYMNDMGELFLRREALGALNSSEVRVLATATDSGTPPRQSSVPVVVQVAPRLLAAGRGAGRAAPSLLALLATALAALALLLLALLLYMYRRRGKSTTKAVSPSPGFVQHEKFPAAPPSPRPPPSPRAPPSPAPPAPSGSLLSVSAGASTILANSTSSLNLRDVGDKGNGNGSANSGGGNGRQSQRFPKSRVAPAPPAAAPPPGSPPAVDVALMSDHLAPGGGRSGVAWPAATIPARVKKLSWDDTMRHVSPPTDVLDATNPALQEHMNLTVYF
ncbi:protocadherin-16 [Plutella xylostella]|uniref:protocadherin-16 n=1 Tax=Plutella xylostella TaxID=51655 RepID=UPI002032446F|nr:protocadherin-16 [Plutella xylostella]